MTFPTGTGILMPEQFDIVHQVFADISSEDWFTRSEERREQFAIFILDLYRSGVCDPHILSLRCRSYALVRFGNGGLAH